MQKVQISAPEVSIHVLSIESGSETPFTSKFWAANKNGMISEFITYPGCSLWIGTGTIPIAFAKSIKS